MTFSRRFIFFLTLLLISSLSICALDLRLGVAIVKDTDTAILYGEDYTKLIDNVEKRLLEYFIPVLVIESDYISDGSLDYVDAALIVSGSALNHNLKNSLEEFVGKGGVLAATFDTAFYDIAGDPTDSSWLFEILGGIKSFDEPEAQAYEIEYDNSSFLFSEPVALIKPTEVATAIGSFADLPDFAPIIRTDKTLYAAMDPFTKANSEIEKLFLEQLLDLIGEDYAGQITMSYEELRPLASETRSLLRTSQREYRTTTKIQELSDDVLALYEESLMWSDAMQFAVENRSVYHLPKYTMAAKKVGEALYEKASLVQIPIDTLKARGTYWEGRVNTFAKENVPENPIVFIGDSITERFDLAKHFPAKPVINRGIGGDMTSGIWDRLHLLGLEKNPKKIFVMIGTNNVLYNHDLVNYITDVERTLLYLKDQVPGAEIFLQSICPLAETTNISPSTVQKYNQDLQDLAIKRGFTYIDIYSLLADDQGYLKPEYTIDGVHLTPLGYKVWTEDLEKYM